jgi:hypothetical protein
MIGQVDRTQDAIEQAHDTPRLANASVNAPQFVEAASRHQQHDQAIGSRRHDGLTYRGLDVFARSDPAVVVERGRTASYRFGLRNVSAIRECRPHTPTVLPDGPARGDFRGGAESFAAPLSTTGTDGLRQQ